MSKMLHKKKNKFIARLKKASTGVFSLGVLLFLGFSLFSTGAWYVIRVMEIWGREIPLAYPFLLSFLNSLVACAVVILVKLALLYSSQTPKYVVGRLARRIGPILLFILIIGAYFLFNQKIAPVAAGWWNDAWSYRKAITINHTKVVGDQVNFPVLVSFTDSNLINHAQTDGDDFIFISSEGQKLSHEIEKYASTTGELIAWVKIPALSAANDTLIYLYYGNPSASSGQAPIQVWDDNFNGVWHMNNSASASSTDSTRNSRHGSVGGATASSTAKIAGGLTFSGGGGGGSPTKTASTSPGTMATSTISGATEDWLNINYAKVADGNKAEVYMGYFFYCLSPDTLVSQATGSIEIEDIEVGMTVKSYNESTGNIELKEVTAVNHRSISYYGSVYYRILYDGGEIRATFNHRFFVNGKYIMARDLKVGDELMDIAGQSQRIQEIILEENTSDDVWDIGVADNHNFFANDILVHNHAIDMRVRIIKGGSIGSTDKSKAGNWPYSLAYYTYGGDLWGESWTAADINSSDFGVAIAVDGSDDWSYDGGYLRASNFGFSIPTGASINAITAEFNKSEYYGDTYLAEIDHIRMTIEYTAAGSSIYIGDTGSIKTASFWLNQATTTQSIMNINSDGYIKVATGTLSAPGVSSPTFYVDGVSTTTISTGWHYVTLTTATAESATTTVFGAATTSYLTGTLDEVRFSAAARSAAWIATEYNNQNSPATFYAVQSEEVGPGPVGYWSFDEGYGTTVNDESGHGYAGTLSAGTSSPWQASDMCISGKCLYFDGYNDYVRVSSGMITAYPFSLGAWVKAIGPANDSVVLSLQDKDVANIMYGLYVDSSPQGAVQVRARNTTSYDNYGQKYISDNKWHYITGIFNTATDRQVYIDGELQNIGSITSATYNTAVDSLDIGRWGSSTPSNYFTGFIDEVKIYSYARSANEIRADFAAGLAGVKTQHGIAASFGDASDKWLTDGLVGYWSMDEASWTAATSTLDYSGSANHGDAVGHASTSAGKFGNGGIFDGNGDYVRVTNNASFQLTYDMTISLWFKADAYGQYDTLISNENEASGGAGHYVLRNDFAADSFELIWWDGANVRAAETVAAPSTGVWHHLTAVVLNNDISAIYFDGVSQAISLGTAFADSRGNNDLLIGRHHSMDAQAFDGQIDEVRIYNRALSPDEVRKLYEWAPGPVAHWRFDEHQGTTAYDSAASTTFSGGNHGTLGGGAASNQPAWTRGKYGGALNFDGVNDVVWLTRSPISNFAAPATVCAWLYPTDITEDQTIITGTNAGSQFDFHMVGNEVDFSYNVDGTAYGRSKSGILTNNVWTYACGVWDGTDVNLYKDGVALSSLGAIDYGTDGNYIGARNVVQDRPMEGLIDDIRVYNYARTQKQIIEDMNAGHPAGGSPVGSELTYWSFDEGYGTNVNDSTIHAKTLTLSSATGWTLEGKFNRAYQGADNRRAADGADDDDLDFTATEDFALSAWIRYTTTNPANTQYIIHKQTGSEGYALMMNGQGRLSFGIGDTSSTVFPEDYASSTIDHADNEWHHVLGIKTSNTKIELYVDGILVAADTSLAANATLENAATLYIGDANSGDGTDEFLGKIDEVKIYPYTLSPDEIKLDYSGNSAVSMGVIGTETSATSSNAASLQYCIPGDTSYCAPPVGEWRFDEKSGGTAYDMSGNANNGTLGLNPISTSSPTWKGGGACQSGNCLQFNGTNQFIDIVSVTDNVQTGPATFSAWINLPAGHGDGSTRAMIIRMAHTTSNNDLLLNLGGFLGSGGYDDGRLYFTTWNGSDYIHAYSNQNSWTANTWYFVTGVWDGTYLRTYINGTANGSPVSAVRGTTPYSTQANIGRATDQPDPNNAYFPGLIDDVRIYNYVRTPAQIAYDFNRGKPIAHWRFDECAGGTIFDSAVTWNGGTSSNGVLQLGSSGVTATGTCASSSNSFWYNGRSGKYNSAGSFDGTDDYVNIVNNNILNPSIVSYSAWIKITGNGSHGVGVDVLSKGRDTAQPYFSYDLNYIPDNDHVGCMIGLAGSNYVTVESDKTFVPTSDWIHVLCTYDKTNLKLYINGTLEKSGNYPGSIDYSFDIDDNLHIGNWGGTVTHNFQGQIDEVKIWNYMLTVEQVRLEYAGGAVKFGL